MSENNGAPKGPTDTETLKGGADVIATKLDGTTEAVFLRQIAAEDCDALLGMQENEMKIVEFYCKKPEGWAKTLTRDSYQLLVNEGDRINADFFFSWVERRIARQEKLLPGITNKMSEAALAAS